MEGQGGGVQGGGACKGGCEVNVTLDRRASDGAPMLPRTPLAPVAAAVVEDSLRMVNAERARHGLAAFTMNEFVRRAVHLYAMAECKQIEALRAARAKEGEGQARPDWAAQQLAQAPAAHTTARARERGRAVPSGGLSYDD